MINHVEVRTSQGTLLDLQLADPSSEIIVEDIDGLDPVKATIVSSSFASMNGTQYQSSRTENRNILLKLGLEPDYSVHSVRDLRNQLYGFFMPKTQISLRFYMDDGLTVDIVGRVESFQTPLFAKESKVDISILCFDPDFTAIAPVSLSGSTVPNNVETLVTYAGTSETGFTFTLNVNRSLSAFTIYNRLPDNSVKTMNFAASLLTGDVLTISTVSGAKSVMLNRSGVVTSLLYGMLSPSDWVNLYPGANNLRVYATGAAIPFGISYTTRYGGL